MATITANPNRETALFGRVRAAVSDFFAAIAEGRRMAERYETLSRMSDSELARHGFSRAEIPQLVARGR